MLRLRRLLRSANLIKTGDAGRQARRKHGHKYTGWRSPSHSWRRQEHCLVVCLLHTGQSATRLFSSVHGGRTAARHSCSPSPSPSPPSGRLMATDIHCGLCLGDPRVLEVDQLLADCCPSLNRLSAQPTSTPLPIPFPWHLVWPPSCLGAKRLDYLQMVR